MASKNTSRSVSPLPTRDEYELGQQTRPTSQGNDPWNDDLVNYKQEGPPSSLMAQMHSDNKYLPSRSVSRRITQKKNKRKRIMWIIFGGIAVVVIAVAVGVGVTLSQKNRSNSGWASGTTGTSTTTFGNSGSQVTLDDGTTFTYVNDFGGDWAMDPKHPFGIGGKAQSWSPRVGGEDWDWGVHVARGVNLGGWLVTEPFIVPSLYEQYVGKGGIDVLDEWTLSMAMGVDLVKKMEEHYKTFITEKDFADIAAAGLNWVRIPIGYWAIEVMNDEPFLAGTSWTYFLKAIQWARKYGLRIYLDLHSLPGSQNGWNHSGKSGQVNFMHGVMGIANAQRTLTYLRIITEFVSQPQYRDVVGIVGIVNEILWDTIGAESVQSFYFAAYEAMRKATGTGSGPYIAIHEGFQGPAIWEGFMSGADRLALDQHPYLAFMGDTTSTPDQLALKPCGWAVATNQSQKVFGVTLGGEFSSAINNCGLWLNGIGSTPNFPNCDHWDNWAGYTPSVIASLKNVTLASMDALQNFFFWTWKIGNSTQLGTSSAPMWHYKLGLQQGWIPKDPREAIGHCARQLNSTQPFDGRYPSSATGGPGAGTLDPAQSTLHAFPPAMVSPSFTGTQVALLPTYTPTGTIKTLFAPTFTAAPSAVVGTGWTNPDDKQLAFVPIAGCSYPNAWDAVNATLPQTVCTGP
ncbi:hypothetical protein CVT24_008006 [Panaeolus cyanescens]|uniref:glucan 1,3-beta-glucosidase n=1 Tax=Panaeolus cyanescens TaxID=181874 RepID=A0A409YQW8_9AGAR|nr:hypothetical protein CVT24_008006 [Panaeolus cyanescens]